MNPLYRNVVLTISDTLIRPPMGNAPLSPYLVILIMEDRSSAFMLSSNRSEYFASSYTIYQSPDLERLEASWRYLCIRHCEPYISGIQKSQMIDEFLFRRGLVGYVRSDSFVECGRFRS